jgi:galactosyl transferase GMA12/MNN10 family
MASDFKIVMFSTPGFTDQMKSPVINRAYCRQHGYAFAMEEYDRFPLTASHEKIRVMHRHLHSAEYILWLDSDAVVIDFSQTLDQFCTNRPDVVIAGHQYGFDLNGNRVAYEVGGISCGLNGGVFLLRNSQWTHEFLYHWWDRCVEAHARNTPFWEQGPLQQLFVEDAMGMQARTNLVTPSSRLNRCDDHGRDVCEFILHLWGTSNEHRAAVFAEILRGRRPNVAIELPTFSVPFPIE